MWSFRNNNRPLQRLNLHQAIWEKASFPISLRVSQSLKLQSRIPVPLHSHALSWSAILAPVPSLPGLWMEVFGWGFHMGMGVGNLNILFSTLTQYQLPFYSWPSSSPSSFAPRVRETARACMVLGVPQDCDDSHFCVNPLGHQPVCLSMGKVK